jgi:hypothetical protein
MADPQKYRDRAARLREEAERAIDPETRAQLLAIALQYEKLAEGLERRRIG